MNSKTLARNFIELCRYLGYDVYMCIIPDNSNSQKNLIILAPGFEHKILPIIILSVVMSSLSAQLVLIKPLNGISKNFSCTCRYMYLEHDV